VGEKLKAWDLKRKVRRNTRAVASTRTVLSFEVEEMNEGVHLLAS